MCVFMLDGKTSVKLSLSLTCTHMRGQGGDLPDILNGLFIGQAHKKNHPRRVVVVVVKKEKMISNSSLSVSARHFFFDICSNYLEINAQRYTAWL